MRTRRENDFQEFALAVGDFTLAVYDELVKPILDWITNRLNQITERMKGRK